MLPVPQCKSPWQRGELKLFAGIAQGVSSVAGNPTLGLAQGVSGAAGNPTAGLVQGVADHPTLLKSQGVSAKSMVVKSKAVSGQASVVEANCTNIDVCPELFLPPRDQKRKSVLKDLRLTHLFTMIGKYIKLVLKEGLLTPLFRIRRAWNLKIFLQKFAMEQQTVSADVVHRSYTTMEEGFVNHMRKKWLVKPQIASVDPCYLVILYKSTKGVLYIANTGDSYAVPGRVKRGVKDIKVVQLSFEHNTSFEG